MQTLCVYCGSSSGHNETYAETARQLVDIMHQRDVRLVNGGGSIGIMGIMADRMLELGGKCIGVIPRSLQDKEVAHDGMTELIVVPDMHARKLKMVNLSDAFIGFPGGFGTLDEVFETLTWLQLHLHNKPIGLLNTNGYFDHLIAMLDHMVAEGFLNTRARALLHVHTEIEPLLDILSKPHVHVGTKWT